MLPARPHRQGRRSLPMVGADDIFQDDQAVAILTVAQKGNNSSKGRSAAEPTTGIDGCQGTTRRLRMQRHNGTTL
jgi:hypothetical protein